MATSVNEIAQQSSAVFDRIESYPINDAEEIARC
jgi:hypothetical protein